TSRDLTLEVADKVSYADVSQVINEALNNSQLLSSLELTHIYRADGGTTKNLTFRVQVIDPVKTITSDEANLLIEQVADQVKHKLGAKVV
ncbi:MAG TPA: hypothetical protein VFG56_02440, partial [Candidatus Saccharimonadales bacterium]|nr:hypothetical protein [Candidatus Saccharimonadales bacterium]